MAEHEAVGGSGEHAVIAALRVYLERDVVVVVAAHVIVIRVVFAKVYSVEVV